MDDLVNGSFREAVLSCNLAQALDETVITQDGLAVEDNGNIPTVPRFPGFAS
jgi:hypothetical protein